MRRLVCLVFGLIVCGPAARAAPPAPWWLAWDAALIGRIVETAGLSFSAATEAVAMLDQPGAGAPANVRGSAVDVVLAGPATTVLSATAAVRQRNGGRATAGPAAADGAALAVGGAGPVFAVNEAAGAAVVQGNAVALHIGMSPEIASAAARASLDQRIEAATVSAAGHAASAAMTGVLVGRVGVVAVNQSAGVLGNQANVTAIAQSAVAR